MSALADRLEMFLDDHAPALVEAYFAERDGVPVFTGSQFERMANEANDPNRITAADLVAITTLRVGVPAETAIWLLGPGAGRIQALLSQIPTDVNLWSDIAEVDDSSPAAHLWNLLEEQPNIGWVTAGKLCARKRPRLIPVYDDVARTALDVRKGEFWTTLREALIDRPALVATLETIHADAGAPAEVPLLRVLDIAIWMRNHGKASAGEESVRAIPSIS